MSKYRKSISNKRRFMVLKRDGYTCQYCGRKAPDVVLNIDHILPLSKGGTSMINNLITTCRDCNNGKGKQTLEDEPSGIQWETSLLEIDLVTFDDRG